MQTEVPFQPVNGKILVKQLPFKPSKTIQIISYDKADENEGIVVALSPCRYGRKKVKREWCMTGDTFPHEVKIGDRVLFPGKYQDDDTMTFNGVKHRCLDSWEILGILEKPQPEGYTDSLGTKTLDDIHTLFSA